MINLHEKMQAWMAYGKADWTMSSAKISALMIPSAHPYKEFFSSVKELILIAHKYHSMIQSPQNLANHTLAELIDVNKKYFADIKLPADSSSHTGYNVCLGNPDYAVKTYGESAGQIICTLYSSFRFYLQLMIQNRFLELTRLNSLFLDLFHTSEDGEMPASFWRDKVKAFMRHDIENQTLFNLYWQYSPANTLYKEIIEAASFEDVRYLYRYGIYISEHDLAMARYMSAYPEQELKDLSKYIIKSYVDGFVRGNRDYKIKQYASLIVPVGMEKLCRYLIDDLKTIGLTANLKQPQNKSINRQYGYDHRFDNAVYLDEAYVNVSLPAYEKAVEQMKDMLNLNAGPVYLELFGEEPFSPASKRSALKLNDEQQKISRTYQAKTTQLFYSAYNREETSFCIIAFPSPEIGKDFNAIFADTVKINLLDSMHYARIQQNIIDVLDTADYVQIKGKAGNDTDIRVQLHPLVNPEKETNFENCVADVNIPVGEVFTSPLLNGTNGTLHVEDIYLRGLRFYNLKITFKDGWVESYSCTNFDSEEEGIKYVEENLLLPHKSLPIGEFAIGTNTTAYQIAKKYDILALLPILIIEKMGPHFAIGDTCYSHEEDADHFNFINGKKIIAVENEKSATRREDPINAYLQAHTDITLPYEMLESITAVRKDGSTADIIRDGLFAVAGAEELNIPLNEMRKG